MTQLIESNFELPFVHVARQVAIHGKFKPEGIAFIEGDREVTWKQYDQEGDKIAHALMSAGIQKGDRVAILVGNSLWAHELILGIWRAGAAVVPLSPLLTAEVLKNMLIDSGARYMFADSNYFTLAEYAVESLSIPLSGPSFELPSSNQEVAKTTQPDIKKEDLAVIIYSSGTTGTPKGIAHTHESRQNFAKLALALLTCHQDSVCLSIIPPHSNGAWLSWLPAKLIGATTVIMSQFDPDRFLEVVRRHRPTYGFLVPAICAVLLEHPEIESAGLDCFECAITAGAPMMAPMKKEMQRLTNGGLYELWGLTEGIATAITPEEMRERPASVGRPLTGCEIRLINENDEDVTCRGTGEIVGYSEGMMSGYWNRPQDNEALVWTDKEGQVFIRTGDIGEIDEAGYLTLRGRSKDMIISGGLNVFPIDIETTIQRHEDVRDVAVTGVPHEKWGETPIAFIVAKKGIQIDPLTMKSWANERLSKTQRINDVVVLSHDLPRNTLGKVLKTELKADYLANHS
ncbi:acyl--CoA ligase [Pseudomaricurvus alkylphenolicus]|uniref:class I adenylate-forming enzyme family protein n=1 Tax=Pseudomaricurvus alkylphenolicus TaxID=1306991 RepID=UPI001422A716|nr:class I adenylate-forming enzyme family protein [Pseudomaricurvus alkylphenolicus]NIB42449.1 acyl--CoA ligase [Pseudomaricurvus alkylphenolicus]